MKKLFNFCVLKCICICLSFPFCSQQFLHDHEMNQPDISTVNKLAEKSFYYIISLIII